MTSLNKSEYFAELDKDTGGTVDLDNISFDRFRGTYVPADLMRDYKAIKKQILDGIDEKTIEENIKATLQQYSPRKSGRPLESKVDEYKTELVRKSRVYNSAVAFYEFREIFEKRIEKYLRIGDKNVVWWIKNSLPYKTGIFCSSAVTLNNMGTVASRLFNSTGINKNNICYFSRLDASCKQPENLSELENLISANAAYNTAFNTMDILDWMFADPNTPECYPLNGNLYSAIIKDAMKITKEKETEGFLLSQKILENGPLILNDIKTNPYKYTRAGFKKYWEEKIEEVKAMELLEGKSAGDITRQALEERLNKLELSNNSIGTHTVVSNEALDDINSKINQIKKNIKEILTLSTAITEIIELEKFLGEKKRYDSPGQISLFSLKEIEDIVSEDTSNKQSYTFAQEM